MVYCGDEIAMRGGADPDNRRDFPGGFPGHASNAFDAAGRSREQQEVFEYVRHLIQLRRQIEPLRIGALLELAVGGQTYAYGRKAAKDSAVILLNNGNLPTTVDCDLAPLGIIDATTLSDQLGTGLQVKVAGEVIKVELAAHSAAVLVPKN
jgi:glycosidase